MSTCTCQNAQLPEQVHCLANVDTLIIAGGLGTRIRPALGDTPKLLAPIAGRPYVTYLLWWLRGFGVRRIVLGLGYRAAAVVDFLESNPSYTEGLTVVPVIEPRPLGTAGAIRFARPRLESDPALIINGDSFARVDLCQFLDHHKRGNAGATLLCAEVGDARRYGRIDLDETGHVRGFMEKDSTIHGAGLVSAGIYLFSARLLDDIAAGEAVSLEKEIFGCAPAGMLNAYTGRFAFIDIGTPESLSEAELSFADIFDSTSKR